MWRVGPIMLLMGFRKTWPTHFDLPRLAYLLVNEQLCKKLKTKNCTYICNKNISLNHLNNGGLHLNKRGDGALALNLINHIRS